MKITYVDVKENNKINEDYRGLARSKDNYIWLVTNGGAVCLGSSDGKDDGIDPLVYNESEWARAINDQGPFVAWDGEVVIKNG